MTNADGNPNTNGNNSLPAGSPVDRNSIGKSTDRQTSHQKPRLGAPPDGGWGWVVVLSSFSISLLVDGVCFSFGIFFDDFRSEFRSNKATTSWIGSVLNGSYLIFGPLVSALVNIYGCRRVAMCGAILSSVAFFCSSYTHSIGMLIFTFGFLGGIGFGLMYLPAIVIVGYYFERRRALATGIACCGSGIGAFLFAPFTEYLLTYFGWRGATWIISGLVLNGFMFALFYRPLPGPIMEDSISTRSSPTSQTDTLTMEREGAKHSPQLVDQYQGESLQGDSGKASMQDQTNPHVTKKSENASLAIDSPSNGIYRTRSVTLSGPGKVVDDDTTAFRTDILRLTRSQDFSPPRRGNPQTDKSNNVQHPARMEQLHLQRKDIFYSGSLWHLKEYQELGSMEEFRREMMSTTTTTVPTPALLSKASSVGDTANPTSLNATASRPSMKEAISSIFDIHLLKSPTFLIYGLACFLCMAGFFVPFIYMPGHAITMGTDTRSAAFLISIIGITNTVGRVAVGFISDQPWADCLLINNVALLIGGAVTVFVPFFQHYYVLAIYSAVFGSSIAVFVSLRSIIMVELMGLDKLTTAFGFVIMFQGFSSLLGPPIAGALSDSTGNYNAAFYMSGLTLFLSGAICIPLRRVARWENKKLAEAEALAASSMKGGSSKKTHSAPDSIISSTSSPRHVGGKFEMDKAQHNNTSSCSSNRDEDGNRHNNGVFAARNSDVTRRNVKKSDATAAAPEEVIPMIVTMQT